MSTPSQAYTGSGPRETVPTWAVVMDRWTRYLTEDLGGGPRVIKIAQMINVHKVITAFLIYGMMVHFDNFSTAAWVYLALHGTYGYCWLVKDFAFRDIYFDRRVTFGGVLATYVGLVGWYWLLPYLFISRSVQPSNAMLWFCISLHTLGCVVMVAADLQKNLVLRLRKGLITDGVFTYTRNPNYLGEVMIYGSYALLVNHWAGWLVVLWCWLGLFLPRMLLKDVSISRHAGWIAYKERSGLLFPWRILTGRAVIDRIRREEA
jgi:protein-S-isoprenylcysteine O-methyltransferase Ste14